MDGERGIPADLAGYEKFFAKGFKSGSDPKTRACIGESNIDKIRAAGFSECSYWVNLDGWSKLVHSQDLQGWRCVHDGGCVPMILVWSAMVLISFVCGCAFSTCIHEAKRKCKYCEHDHDKQQHDELLRRFD